MREPAGFRDFVAARSPALLGYAWLLTGDRMLAEDLLSTALAKTWPKWSSLKDPQAGEAYVRRVLMTTQITWWRRRWRAEVPTADLPDRPDDAVGADAFGAVDLRGDLAAALSQLPRRQRAVVVLRYYADLSEVQVAAELGISIGTVKSQHAKALAKLRAMPLLAPELPTAARAEEVTP